MAVYMPHGESVVQTVFRKSRTSYEGYAFPPADTLARVDEFLACADWTRGVARVKCTACDYSYFCPFSCTTFHLCPSCDQKRTILYAEYLADELLLELPHRQFVFTVPGNVTTFLMPGESLRYSPKRASWVKSRN